MLQMSVAWQWRFIYDFETRQKFCISPLFGSLHVWKSYSSDRKAPPHFTFIGCTHPTYFPSAFVDDPKVLPPLRLRQAGNMAWSRFISLYLKRNCLLGLIHGLERSAKRRCENNCASNENVDMINASWAAGRNGECLPRALYRYYWGRKHGLDVVLEFGVFPPTDQMHAWVSLNDVVIGEEPDEMLCYRSVLRVHGKS